MTTTTTQTWIRAELIAAGGTPFGPQLMIPADGLEFHGADLVFHCQGEVVYVAEAAQLRSVTWVGKQPGQETSRRKAQWPQHGVRWTDEERAELRGQLIAGESWAAISKAHGRSRSGVQQEALKQGWVAAVTFEVREGLGQLGEAEGGQAESDAAGSADQGAAVAGDAPVSENATVPDKAESVPTTAEPVLSRPAEGHRTQQAIPAPRSRPELTSGSWYES